MDAFLLDRFIAAQEGVHERALAELRRGKKRTHWMWFEFPQASGLGTSDMSRRFAISSLAEARAYLDHAVLGARLRALIEVLQDLPDGTAEEVFGPIDAFKFRSSLTLFEKADPGGLFQSALDRWFGGERDPLTLELLGNRITRRWPNCSRGCSTRPSPVD